ncbi:MAG: M20 family metallopeptidase [Candidatus Acidiferrum sp.]
MKEPNLPKELLGLLQPRIKNMLPVLEKIVKAESPSMDKALADRCAMLIASEWRRRGAKTELLAQKHRGDHVCAVVSNDKNRSDGQLLVLGHYDTVYSAGTLAKMPYRVTGGRAYGPGTFDMKAGIVQALFALEALLQANVPVRKRLVFLWTSDEEIGSESSRKLIETEARTSDAVFVLEPAYGKSGLLKTARKGIGGAEIIVYGRASHAGLAPEEGINAIHELAAQLARTETWNNPRRGITVNAGTIEGGTRTNVIPERARALLDLRAMRIRDMRTIERKLRRLRPFHKGAKLEVHGGFDRPPLERKMSAALFARAKSIAAQINLQLGECTVGGGSDGNFTAALGTPTLDGMGPVGDGAHSSHEHVLVSAMPVRAALLAALLANS